MIFDDNSVANIVPRPSAGVFSQFRTGAVGPSPAFDPCLLSAAMAFSLLFLDVPVV